MTTWMKISEAADYAGVGYKILHAAIDTGDLPSYTPSKRTVLLKASDVDEWIESKPNTPKRRAS
jgi:excisionase family DNA binding protein